MNKLYPRLLQQETNGVAATSPLVRSQSVRGASKGGEGERKVHLYEEVILFVIFWILARDLVWTVATPLELTLIG